jgi:predicted nucleic acid-binding protein
MGLIEAIGTGPVGLDTVVFIYFIEEHSRYLSVVEPIFERIDAGALVGFTSSLTLLEVLVVPFRAGDQALAERYERLLGQSRGLSLVEIDRPLLRAAALLRAKTRVRTPDAIQVATALSAQCSTFVTNDRELPDLPGISILQIDDYG